MVLGTGSIGGPRRANIEVTVGVVVLKMVEVVVEVVMVLDLVVVVVAMMVYVVFGDLETVD